MAQDKKYIPELRFPEFKNDGGWILETIGTIADTFSGGTPTVGNKEYYGGDIPFIRSGEISNDKTELFITESGLSSSSAKMVDKGTILYAMYGATSGEVAISKISGAINQAILAIIPKSQKYSSRYIYHYLKHNKQYILGKYLQGGQGNLSANIINNLPIYLPCDSEGEVSIKEQQKIADCLSSLDEYINVAKQKVDQLKEHKKGLMQRLFPAKGKTTPEFRFPKFYDNREWAIRPLSDILYYEQPTQYIVEDTGYKKKGIPVLTANKGFILGYTSETSNIYNNLPVIIFDDFTTDKKFVEFPFKVKSSAIKLLKLKDESKDHLRFVFESMNNIVFEEKEHKRYYISTYQNLEIPIPSSLEEQNKIAETITQLDNLLKAFEHKIVILNDYKHGLMQRIFPKL